MQAGSSTLENILNLFYILLINTKERIFFIEVDPFEQTSSFCRKNSSTMYPAGAVIEFERNDVEKSENLKIDAFNHENNPLNSF